MIAEHIPNLAVVYSFLHSHVAKNLKYFSFLGYLKNASMIFAEWGSDIVHGYAAP